MSWLSGLCLAMTAALTLTTCANRPDLPAEPASPKGASTLTQNELLESLRRLSPNQKAALSALAKNVVKDSRALPRTAAAHLNDADRNLADNAISLLIDLEDLAAVPVLEVPE